MFAALSHKQQYTLIGNRLYLSEQWIRDRKRCDNASIPNHERVYKSKPELSLELVMEAQVAGVRFGTVTADAVYGGSEFSHTLDAKGLTFSLDIRGNYQVYLHDPKPALPKQKGTKGRPRTFMKTTAQAITVAALARTIKK